MGALFSSVETVLQQMKKAQIFTEKWETQQLQEL